MPSIPRAPHLSVIGVDCATQPKSVGLARCVLAPDGPRIEEVAVERTWAELDARVAGWIVPDTLLALDAPLGWPMPLRNVLGDHRAGDGLPGEANALFRRQTDDVVAEALGKRPLDVGADRIARTAHAALGLLARVRRKSARPIPLAWTPDDVAGAAAVEVYPAGTLASRGLPSAGYKGDGDPARSVRREILGAVKSELTLDARGLSEAGDNDHVLDAVLCCLAGSDFLRGVAMPPDDLGRAQREGWIWVRRPDCG